MTEWQWQSSADPAAMLEWLQRGQVWHSDTHAQSPPRLSERKLRLFACAVGRAVGGDPRFLAVAERYADRREGDGFTPGRLSHLLAESDDACVEAMRGSIGDYARADVARVCLMADWSLADHVGQWDDLRQCAMIERAAEAAILRDVVGDPFRPVSRYAFYHCDDVRGDVPGPLLTPQVLTLAHAAYDLRHTKPCVACSGHGFTVDGCYPMGGRPKGCHACAGTGSRDDGTLDGARLAVLSDALEEAGCPAWMDCPDCDGSGEVDILVTEDDDLDRFACHRCKSTGSVPHPLLGHLRGSATHCRGCWALDLLLEQT